MALHTAAVLDRGRLAAGAATPILTTHLALAVLAYPLFGVILIGQIWVGARSGTLGSWWVAPIGMVGALAHGTAAPLVVLFKQRQFRFLFAGIALIGLWCVLVALWPQRRSAPVHES